MVLTETGPVGDNTVGVGIYRFDLLQGQSLLNYSKAVTMPMNEAASSDAPPMRPPSTSGLANRALALEGLQLPP